MSDEPSNEMETVCRVVARDCSERASVPARDTDENGR